MYYSKIIKKIILKKYAIILCGHTKNLFKTNYYFMNSFYSSNCFTDINILIIAIKKIIPLLMSILKKKNLLFIGTRFLYSKTISNSIFLSHKLVIRKPGIFSNFSITSFYSMYKVALKKIPNVIFFFYLKWNDFLLREAKIKSIPIVALISSKDNSNLIDYPIMVNSSHYHTIYFFSLFWSRFLRLN